METNNHPSKTVRLLLHLVFAVALCLGIILSSCSNKEKVAGTQSEIAPPPPPPPLPPDPTAPESNLMNPDEIFVTVENMPHFPGGETELIAYLDKTIQYPENEKNNGVQGMVIVRFCVTANGKVEKVSVLKGASPSLDSEALRAVSELPDWIPGKQNGQNVNVGMLIPIQFALK